MTPPSSSTSKIALLVLLALTAMPEVTQALSECKGSSSCTLLNNTMCEVTKYCKWNSTACTGKEFECEYIQADLCETVPGCYLRVEETTDIFVVVGIIIVVVVVAVIVGFIVRIVHKRSNAIKNGPMLDEINESAYEENVGMYNPPESGEDSSYSAVMK